MVSSHRQPKWYLRKLLKTSSGSHLTWIPIHYLSQSLCSPCLPLWALFPPSPVPPTHSGLPIAPQQVNALLLTLTFACAIPGSVSSCQMPWLTTSLPWLPAYVASIPLPTEIRQDPISLLALHHRSTPLFCFILYTSLDNRRFCFVIGLCPQHNLHHESTAVAREPNKDPARGHVQQLLWREKLRDAL